MNISYLEHGLDLLLRHALGGLEDVRRVHEAGERVEGVVDLQVRRLQVRLDECLRRDCFDVNISCTQLPAYRLWERATIGFACDR